MDLDTSVPLWLAGSPIYTRGLAASKDHVLVGESQKTGRDLRRNSMSGLWIVDRKTWRSVDYFCLGPYGAVNEVRLLDVPDDAHHGIVFDGVGELCRREGVFRSFESQRLAEASLAYRSRLLWAGLDLVFGSPRIVDSGGKMAHKEDLCLAIRTDSERFMSFEYEIDGGPDSHVSAIAGYRGTGSDTNMAAFLLQASSEAVAHLTLWRHKGEAWEHVPGLLIENLPLNGRLSFEIVGSEVHLRIGDTAARIPTGDIALGEEILPIGVRWIGGTVTPIVA
ncbi:hypothetical protein D3C81_1304590 [compost metagenome]